MIVAIYWHLHKGNGYTFRGSNSVIFIYIHLPKEVLLDFPPCFHLETIFVTACFLIHGGQSLPKMRSSLKGKNLLQWEQILSFMR